MKSKAILLCTTALFAFAGGTRAQEVARPKILGISHVALACADVDASRAFYKGFLGFDEPYAANNPDGALNFVCIKINDLQQIQLFPATAKDTSGNRVKHFALITDNCEGMRLYLKSKGWKVPDKPVAVNSFGSSNMTVRDPDGHGIEFVEYAGDGWTLRDKGLHLPASRISPRIRHIGFTVTDFEAALRFYKDVLGCTEIWRGSQNGKFLSYVNLRLPGCDEYLEFILYGGAEPAGKRLGSMNHICLEAADVDGAYATLQGRALPKGCAAMSAPKTGQDNKRQINCYDPDGTRVEIMSPESVTGKPAPWTDAPAPAPDKLRR